MGAGMVFLSALALILLPYVVVQGQELKKCKFNGKGIAVGEVAYQLTENCVELVCKHNGKKSLLVLQHIDGCTFIDTTTAAPTTPAVPKCDYTKFGSAHTMNLAANPKCDFHKTGVTAEEKQIILETHNMNELIWNDQLAEVA